MKAVETMQRFGDKLLLNLCSTPNHDQKAAKQRTIHVSEAVTSEWRVTGVFFRLQA